jgi:uncharacterized membrane protein YdjX (TVP38/TMEM64 family)
MKSGFKKKLFIVIALLAVILLVWYSGVGRYLTLASLKENRLWLHDLVEHNYWSFLASYFAIDIALTTLPLPVTALFSLAGGLFFGAVLGAIYSNVAATAGSLLFFLFIRYVFGKNLQERYQERLKDFNEEIALYGYSYLLSVHFFTVVPLFIVNILAGLTNVSIWTFVWTTVVGMIPGTFIFAFAGQQLMSIESVRDVFSGGIIFALLVLLFLALIPVLMRFYKKAQNNKKKNGL